jgi:tetratricopeptide (TPR) repeat protein
LFALSVALLGCTQLLACAQSKAADSHGKGHVSALKALLPEADYSVTGDPADIFDEAVKAYAARHYEEAERLFEKVISIDPYNADAHYNLGAIKEWNKDYKQALLHYEAALKVKPSDQEIRAAVTGVAFKIRNLPAIEAREQEIKRERELQMHSEAAKWAFAQQDYAHAATHLGYLARAMPEDSKVQFALGQSLRALKSYELAGYRLKLAIYLDPQNDLYRHTLVDLDHEIQDAQGMAIDQTIKTALEAIAPLAFTELGDAGISINEF